MVKCAWVATMAVSVAMLLVAESAPASEAGGKKPPKKPSMRLRGEWAIMASHLKLDDEQKAKIIGALTATKEANAEKRKELAAKSKELMAQAKAARKAGQKDKYAELRKQARDLAAEMRALSKNEMAAVMAILSDEQKAEYRAYSVDRYVRARLGRKEVKLTDEQTTKIGEIAKAALAALEGEPDGDAMKTLRATVLEKATKEVLTDEQRAAYEKRGGRGKKERKRPPKRDEGAGEEAKGVRGSQGL
jgi:hypothetical protein